MDDAAAYLEMVRANAQCELSALERGFHALRSPQIRRQSMAGSRTPMLRRCDSCRAAGQRAMSRNNRLRLVGDELVIGEIHIPLPRHLHPATTERVWLEAAAAGRKRRACSYDTYAARNAQFVVGQSTSNNAYIRAKSDPPRRSWTGQFSTNHKDSKGWNLALPRSRAERQEHTGPDARRPNGPDPDFGSSPK